MGARRTFIIAVMAVLLVALPASAYATFQYPEVPIYTPNLKQQIATQTAPPAHDTFGLVSPTYVPPGVNSAGVYTTPITPGSKGATATYNLDWTIGTAGKSGCMVCHGDPNLRRIVGGQSVSMYVDTAVLQNSAHAKLLCTDCHTDFAYKVPHPTTQAGNGWQAIAKSSCKTCHNKEYLDWAKSSHSTAGKSASANTVGRPDSSAPGMPRPQCGDCHGGHAIPSAKDADGQAALHASALSMCGKCHVKSADDYADYYHGAAYRRGATDAPACWQCHDTHQILPSSDRLASTYADNLPATCGKCHKDAGPGYVQYAQLVHNQRAVLQKNPVFSVVDTATAAIESMFRSVLSVFGKGGS